MDLHSMTVILMAACAWLYLVGLIIVLSIMLGETGPWRWHESTVVLFWPVAVPVVVIWYAQHTRRSSRSER